MIATVSIKSNGPNNVRHMFKQIRRFKECIGLQPCTSRCASRITPQIDISHMNIRVEFELLVKLWQIGIVIDTNGRGKQHENIMIWMQTSCRLNGTRLSSRDKNGLFHTNVVNMLVFEGNRHCQQFWVSNAWKFTYEINTYSMFFKWSMILITTIAVNWTKMWKSGLNWVILSIDGKNSIFCYAILFIEFFFKWNFFRSNEFLLLKWIFLSWNEKFLLKW